MCQSHYWKINSENIGVCKDCGVVKDFVPINRKFFPHEYDAPSKWVVQGKICNTGGYYLQGSLRLDCLDLDKYSNLRRVLSL